ncbi:MAG: hypothetical protein ABIH17_09565 [Pseudomonadota bacterium]
MEPPAPATRRAISILPTLRRAFWWRGHPGIQISDHDNFRSRLGPECGYEQGISNRNSTIAGTPIAACRKTVGHIAGSGYNQVVWRSSMMPDLLRVVVMQLSADFIQLVAAEPSLLQMLQTAYKKQCSPSKSR